MAVKSDLVQAIRKRTGLTVRDAALCVDTIAEWVEEMLILGKSITLRGLGTFEVRQTAAKRLCLNNTSKSIVPAHGKIIFRPSEKLKIAVWQQKA